MAQMTKSAPRALRLPLALGMSCLMVTGSAAMAWPVLKTAFVPTATATAPLLADDPAAVSGFVDMTRAQVALAQNSDNLAPVRVNAATNLMLDASVLRQPMPMQDAPAIAVAPSAVAPAYDTPIQTAQVPAMRPAPRPEALNVTTAPVAKPAAAPQVIRASAPVAAPATPAPSSRDRLMSLWISGAYR
jgi:hypothetical protein